MSIYVIWLEDRATTVAGYKFALSKMQIPCMILSTPQEIMAFASDPEAPFRASQLKPVFLVDLMVYGDLHGEESHTADTHYADLGLRFIRQELVKDDFEFANNPIYVLTEREDQEGTLQKVLHSIRPSLRLFRKYDDDNLAEFITLMMTLKGGSG